jgi:hypothetical protein
MKLNVTFSGAVGRVRPAVTSVHLVWLTAVKAAFAPGLIRFLPADKRVRPFSNEKLYFFFKLFDV